MRKWIANKLAGLARRIYPQSEEVMAFYMDRMVDFVLTGKSNIKVSYVPDEEMYERSHAAHERGPTKE